MSEETAEVTASKRPRKLIKDFTDTAITLEVPSAGETLSFELADFSKVSDQLFRYGLSQKLGDAAAGKDGQEAIDAINKVAEGLIKGDWSVRAPAAPKVTKAQINENLSNMSDKERAQAEELLKKLGITK